jgi:hypothetical protein
MSQDRNGQSGTMGGVLGATALMDRLNNVRKRKRAFEWYTVDMELARRRVEAKRRRKRGR